ncbi:MAG: hypothetical protein B6D41_22145 [Chloroflexi bacterium UTCFX4]|nr:MAG: hypothetical protein B6D41_22145 [Chloroflexi bacterium UTCFX4]
MKQCPVCKNNNEDAAMFCDNCGSPLGGSAPVAPPPVNNMPQVGGMPMGQPASNAAPMGGAPAAGGGNITCPQCGTSNIAGTLYCDNCGSDLRGASAAPMGGNMGQPQYTPPVYTPPAQPVYTPPQPAYTPPAQSQYPPVNVAPTPPRIMAGGQSLMVPQKNEIIIGRSDAASGWTADVDLTPAGGTADQGVSRRHAKLTWQGQWMLEDMDSVNGTYLRGQKLVPMQKNALNNGEGIQIGRIQITFYQS